MVSSAAGRLRRAVVDLKRHRPGPGNVAQGEGEQQLHDKRSNEVPPSQSRCRVASCTGSTTMRTTHAASRPDTSRTTHYATVSRTPIRRRTNTASVTAGL